MRQIVKRLPQARLAGLSVLIVALWVALLPALPVQAQGDTILLTYGAAVDGVITDEVYQVVYQFSGQADDFVIITLDAAPGSDLDPYLLLVDADENVVAENDDSGSLNSRIEATLPASGDYTIIATRYRRDEGSSTGEFILTLDTGAGTGRELAFTCGGVNVPAATLITFEDVRPGFTYRVTVLGMGDFDPVIGLEAADGTTLCNDDEARAIGSQVSVPGTGLVTANGLTSQIVFTTSGATGDVQMRIGGYGGRGGRYVAVFEGLAISPPDEQDAVTLSVSESVQDELIFVHMVSRTTALDPYMSLAGTDIVCDDAGVGECAGTPLFPDSGVSIINGNTYLTGAYDAGIGVVPGSTDDLTFVFQSYQGLSAGDYAMIVVGESPGTTDTSSGQTGSAPSANDVVVTLTWQGTADMDLLADTPDGERIYWDNPVAANSAYLDPVDGNDYCSSIGDPPTERVVIPEAVATGDWLLIVNYSLVCGDSGATSYTVTVTQGSSTIDTFSGTIQGAEEDERHTLKLEE